MTNKSLEPALWFWEECEDWERVPTRGTTRLYFTPAFPLSKLGETLERLSDIDGVEKPAWYGRYFSLNWFVFGDEHKKLEDIIPEDIAKTIRGKAIEVLCSAFGWSESPTIVKLDDYNHVQRVAERQGVGSIWRRGQIPR